MFKKFSFWLILAYTLFTFLYVESFSNSLVIISLVCLYGFELYLDRCREKDPKVDENYEKMRTEIELENLKLSLENMKDEKVRRAEMRAAREKGGVDGSKFIF